MKWYGILGLVIQSTVWIAVVFVLSVWVYLGLSEYFSSCFRFGLRRPAALLGVAGESSTTSRGLQPTEMERYPKFSYPKDEDNTSRGITECVVCLGQFNEGETLRLIPLCGHVFHADCVDVWFRSHTTCPCCRANLRLQPPEPTVDSPV